MRTESIDFKSTGKFQKIFTDYIDQKDSITPFQALPPRIESFENCDYAQLPDRVRTTLVASLEEQYASLTPSKRTKEHINSLNASNCFTVTTGHQLQLFGGPLFFIYKILDTIKLAERLNNHYPDKTFVPVFWMASEDHDFEEINHFNLFGKRVEWNQEVSGAVGRLLTTGIDQVLADLPDGVPDFLKEAYHSSKNLSEATRKWVFELFDQHGLVILDADQRGLKEIMSPLVHSELLHGVAKPIVEATGEALTKSGYKTQAFCREINLFYLKEGIRERIEQDGLKWKVVNTEVEFSQDAILEEAEKFPERFSPNVILRPVYQQMILPNVAYVGGPGELAYWFQLKDLFNHLNVSFPVLMPRFFGLVINGAAQKKMLKTGLNIASLMKPEHELKDDVLLNAGDISPSFENPISLIQQAFDDLREEIVKIEPQLKGYLGGEERKMEKQLEGIAKKLKKSFESKQETKIGQAVGLQAKLFPNGGLQERHDNFLNFYINDADFLNKVLKAIDPFDLSFTLLFDE